MPHRGLRRFVTLVLAVFLLLGMLPAPARAEEPTPEQIKKQITTLYAKAKARSGKESMSGYCAALVNWQLYLLGIDSSLKHCNGKDEYNIRSAEEKTESGYYTRCFSCEDYSLEEALNAITMDGQRNAYNLVVGFQWTKTDAGKRYGHTCFISAIIDGVVYFVESDPIHIAGRYYSSGKAITATIAEFAADYKSWTAFEGIVEYIKDPYEKLCTSYSTDIYVQLTQDTPVRTEPCDFAEENIGLDTRTARSGEIFRVTCILNTPEGEYWYKAADGAYFKAEGTKLLSGQFDSVQVRDVTAPAVLTAGEEFTPGGTVTAGNSTVSMLRGQIYSGSSGTGVLLENVTQQVGGSTTSLSDGEISRELHFSELDPGEYHFVLSAVAYNRYVEDGELNCQWQTVDLWAVDFVVTEEPDAYVVAALDTNGGESALRQAVVAAGEPVSTGTEPQRPGYAFSGWSTGADETAGGGIDTDTTVYACWSPQEEILNGWRWVDGAWLFYRRGVQCAGWLEVHGILYYFYEDGSLHQGWLELDGETYYLYENGSAAVGAVEIDGVSYCFDENGALVRPEPEPTEPSEETSPENG